MKKAIILLLLLALNVSVFAQQAKIKAIAQQMAAATMKGDYKVIIEHTDPQTVQKAGGKEAMLKVVSTMMTQMKKQGMAIRSAEVGEPGPIISAGGKKFCMVPEIIKMAVPQNNMTPKGVYTAQSNLLAVSSDGGKTWYFVNSGSMKEEAIYSLYPELKGKLVLPKQTPPQFTPEA